MTTTASASSPTRTCRCPYAVAPSPGPVTTISIGSPSWVSLPTVTIVALLNDENAWAATRSAGTPALAESLVATTHGFHRHAGLFAHVDARAAGRGSGAVVQARAVA